MGTTRDTSIEEIKPDKPADLTVLYIPWSSRGERDIAPRVDMHRRMQTSSHADAMPCHARHPLPHCHVEEMHTSCPGWFAMEALIRG